MVEPISLNKARKAKAAAEAKTRAAANRVGFGRTKSEKAMSRLEAARSSQELDGKRRE